MAECLTISQWQLFAASLLLAILAWVAIWFIGAYQNRGITIRVLTDQRDQLLDILEVQSRAHD